MLRYSSREDLILAPTALLLVLTAQALSHWISASPKPAPAKASKESNICNP